MIPDPTYMELQEWADSTAYEFETLGDFIPLVGTDWQSWGADLQDEINPYQFDDWKEWASRIREVY